jgi:hypothetical protein
LRSRRTQHRRQGPGLVFVRWLDHFAFGLVLDRAGLGFGIGVGLRDAALVLGQEFQLVVQRLAGRTGFGRLVQLERLGHAAEQR